MFHKSFFLAASLIVFTSFLQGCNNEPRGLEGFNGFYWGDTYEQISADRFNDPDVDLRDRYLSMVIWDVEGTETVAGVPIESITYEFKDSCALPSESCHLWAGNYMILEPTSEVFEILRSQLINKYGEDFIRDVKTDTPSVQAVSEGGAPTETTTSLAWSLPDRSEVNLEKRELDKDYTEATTGEVFQSGITLIRIDYYGSEYITALYGPEEPVDNPL